jgi:hypothetical protein
LFGAATLQVDRSPVVAGLLFGAICYKPHFGLLIPVALAAGGHWRAFAGAMLSVLALVVLSLLLFGSQTWSAYLDAMAGAGSVYAVGHLDFAAFISAFGTARALGLPPWVATSIQAAVTLIAAWAVALVWRRRCSLPIRAAVLAAATPIAIPVALVYDLMVSGIAMAWLYRAGMERGFPPWHRLILAVLFVWPIFGLNLDPRTYIMVPPTVAFGVFVLALLSSRSDYVASR